MSKARSAEELAAIATRRATLQADLERLLAYRAPVSEVRRLLAEIDALEAPAADVPATRRRNSLAS